MNIFIEINNSIGCDIDKKGLKLSIEKTIKKVAEKTKIKKTIIVSVGLVSLKEIKKLNSKYRQKNYPTDILSFANCDNKDSIFENDNDKFFLGELVVCCEDIKNYSKKKNISFEAEIFKIVSHGTLHLLGFRHGKEMFKIQNMVSEEVVKKVLK